MVRIAFRPCGVRSMSQERPSLGSTCRVTRPPDSRTLTCRVTVEESRCSSRARPLMQLGPRLVQGAQREIAGPVDLVVQGTLATEGLQVPNELQKLELDNAQVVGHIGALIHWPDSTRGAHVHSLLLNCPTIGSGLRSRGPERDGEIGCGTCPWRRPPKISASSSVNALDPSDQGRLDEREGAREQHQEGEGLERSPRLRWSADCLRTE